MSKIPCRDAAKYLQNLTPFDAGNLRGDGVWVLSPSTSLPEQFTAAQDERRAEYMTSGARHLPAEAPRYVVTSYGVPIAWVTLDGQTHYTTEHYSATTSKHLGMVRSVWPERFTWRDDTDPTYIARDAR